MGNIAIAGATWVRYRVLGMLCLLSFILYLDRICIGQAVADIQRDLKLTYTEMGFILGAFTLAYGLFEVPAGHWGDRYGSRGVLARIVIWWSLFTMLTGACQSFVVMLVVRFLFGAGEAGALPNAARVVARWFPAGARGPAQGIVVTSALLGGAFAPVVAQMLIRAVGWRWSFVILGGPGIAWAIAFYWWFRDNPAEHSAVNKAERLLLSAEPKTGREPHASLPWHRILTSLNVLLLGGIISCASFTTYMFFSWYPSYLQKGRAVDPETSSLLASLVLIGGALGCTLGGYLSDWLVRRTGERRWSRRGIGCFSLMSAGVAMIMSIYFESPVASAFCAAYACFGVHLQQGAWWGVVTEISGKHLGALFGLMNSMGVPGAVSSQLLLGRFVDWLADQGYEARQQWDPAFYLYGGVLILGGVFWLLVDPYRSVVDENS